MRNFLTVLLLAGALIPAAAQSGLELIQPDAGFVVGIELRKVFESPGGAALRQQFSAMNAGPGFQGMVDMLLRDIDSVLLAAPASAIGGGTAKARNEALFVVKGRFDIAALRKALSKGQPGENYRGVELLGASAAASGAKDSSVALLDTATLLGGDRALVRAAIDRARTGRLTRPAGYMTGAAELAASNHIWMVMAPPAGLPMQGAPPMAQQMFADMVSMEMGMSFASGLAMRVNIREKDDTSALRMSQTLQGLVSMAAMTEATPEQLAMLKKVEIAQQGPVVRMSMNLSESELQRIVQQAQAARTAGGGATPTRPAPRGSGSQIKPPEPPKPNTVRITGLDGGPKEVPMTQPKK